MTTIEILKGARELIATPEKWTRETFGRTDNGASTRPSSWAEITPTCFCLVGALLFVARKVFVWDVMNAIQALGFENEREAYIWQDTDRQHAEVLARLDSAIASEEAKVTP